MKNFVLVFIFAVLIFIQFSLPGSYFYKFLIPNIILVFFVSSISHFTLKEIISYSFFIGFIFDLYSMAPFGLFMIVYLTAGIAIYFLNKFFGTLKFYSNILFVAAATFIFYFAYFLMLFLPALLKDQFFAFDVKQIIFYRFPLSLLINIFVSIFIFFINKKLFNWLSYYERKAF